MIQMYRKKTLSNKFHYLAQVEKNKLKPKLLKSNNKLKK